MHVRRLLAERPETLLLQELSTVKGELATVMEEAATDKEELRQYKVWARLGDYAGGLANFVLATEVSKPYKSLNKQVNFR